MATLESVIERVRLEIGDQLSSFQTTLDGHGDQTYYELPNSPLVETGLLATLIPATGAPRTLTVGVDYVVDAPAGVLSFTEAPAYGDKVSVRGTSARNFTDTELALFVSTALTMHLNGRAETLDSLPVVEEYPVALLASIEALYALLNDAAFDIDVSTPEGVGIPRSQRFRQLSEMLELRRQQYAEICMALNVGLSRIEVSTLRRVSRTTGRLVPLYLNQEIEDKTAPRRILTRQDLQGAKPILDPVQVYDLTITSGEPVTLDIDLERDITGVTLRAQIRRHELAAPLIYFDVTVVDAALGLITLSLRDTSRHRLYFDGDLAWDLRLNEPNTPTRSNVSYTLVKGKVYVIERPRI